MKPGTPKLSEAARKVVVPAGITSTAWPRVAATCRTKLGLTFDPWQDQAGRAALAKRADGKFAAMVDGVGLSVCRQAGKTHWLTGLAFGMCIERPGLLVVWSAHHARTHGETFLAMAAFAERQRVAPYVEQVFRGSGDEEIRFRNGSRILFGARERGFGRGIPGVDVIVADEAQIMTERAVDAMTATMNVSDVGLAFYVGTPPRPDDPSEAFTRMRSEAWGGTLKDGVWIEFGADPDADPSHPDTWARANPSYPHRTPAESILRLQRKLSPESFLREGLGIWDSTSAGVITSDMWRPLVDPQSTIVGPLAFGLQVNMARTRAAIGVAGRRADGKIHVGVVPPIRGKDSDYPGTSWVRARVKEIDTSWSPCAVVVDGKSSAASLIPGFDEDGVETVETNAFDMANACGLIYDAIRDDELRHRDAWPLTRSMLSAKTRELANAWAWERRKDKTSDITQTVAVTLAVWGLINHGEVRESAYEHHDLIVV